MHADKIENAGLYLHIPFCINKCPYCDFYSITDLSLKQAFIEALMCEMRMLCNVSFLFDTMYIGGGTPSVLTIEDLAKIIEAACRFFKISADVEITMELNPGTVDREHFAGFKSAGVNRINIGVQSFQDVNLDFLGRIHSGKEAELAIRWARQSGFNNIGLDLIYGIPGQTVRSWLLDLKRAVEFEPEHISCYMLTYESGTPMDINRQKGMFCPAPDSHVCDMFETTIDFLSSSGYIQYEISNFARSGSGGFKSFNSRHNQKYWSFVPYIGLGPSAHSFIEPERYWNCRNVNKYIKELTAGRLPIEGKEVLSREQQMIEAISLGLRMTDGIKTDVFDKKFDVSFNKMFAKTITYLGKDGLIRLTENRCSLTRKGMLFADSITSMLI
ncbi:MAG: radical SAM family heme chaperone HemW [Deltaproteobacteria bacterium]|nr:radical SAM family heme chaperone HemW [Deltaproteobacteria bacterium]MBW2661762.1 radical SAM family heme chaperone HemW [Deltaproteobacteria bacterium]